MKKLQKIYVLLLSVMLCVSLFSGCTRNEEIAEITVHEHNYTIAEAREATCLETGFVRYTCDCGESYSEESDALGHKEAAWEVTMEPTAKGPGLRQQLCASCDAVLFSEPIPAITVEKTGEKMETHPADKQENPPKDSAPAPHRHSYAKTVQEKATCTRSGSVWYGCKCGAGYAEAVPAKGHDLYEKVSEGSCTADTVTEKICADCGRVISFTVTETAPGHRFGLLNDGWKRIEKPACTTPGQEEHICKTCEAVVETRRLDPLGHDFELTRDTAPTCEAEGVTVRTCKRCGERAERRSAPLGHDWTARETVKPTCEDGGYTLSVCTHDNSHTQKTEEIPALGHAQIQWKITRDATCAEEGLEEEICEACGKSLASRSIAKNDHTYSLSQHIAATCLESGSDTYTCQVCKNTYSEELPALGHDYQVSQRQESTCVEAGVEKSTCTRCGDTREEALPLADHTYALSEHRDATCTEDGFDRFACTCGDGYEEPISKTGHSYLNTQHKDATCTEDGFDIFTCPCGDAYEEVIAQTDHRYAPSAHQDPTCAESGFDTYACPCGASYDEILDAIGHSHQLVGDNGHVKTFTCPHCGDAYSEVYGEEHHFEETAKANPTCTAEGYVSYACADCGETCTETLPALDHNAKTQVVREATCAEEGLKTSACTICGQELSSEPISKLPHQMATTITREPDCCNEGEEATACAVCGGEASTVTIPKLAHVEEVTINIEPTCTQEGQKTVSCALCQGPIREEILPKQAHSEVLEVAQPTCTEAGTETVRCILCGEALHQNDIAPLGHDHEKLHTRPATCTREGEDRFRCTRCGDNYVQPIPALSHSYLITDKVNPTCAQEGKIVRTCTICREGQVEQLPKTEHLYCVTLRKGTCVEEEKTVYTCGICGDSYEEITGGLGEHLFEITSNKTVTCTEDGQVVSTCKHCSEQKVKTIPTIGHSYALEDTVQATCTQEGAKRYACVNCGEPNIETLPALGHVPGDWETVKEPTETEAGLRRKSCQNCETVMDEEPIEPVKPVESIDREFTVDLGGGQTTTVYGHLDYDMAEEIFELLNLYRQEQGLNTLKHHDGLDAGTAIRAPEQAVAFSHTRPNGSSWTTAIPTLRGWRGENLAKLYRSAESVMEGWKNSPGHNANMLDAHYNYASIGVFAQRQDFSDGSYYYNYYFVQLFKS